MKRVTNLTRFAEAEANILCNFPNPAWCDVTVVPATTGKTYRVTVWGKMAPGSKMEGKNRRCWIEKNKVDSPYQAACLATHIARIVKTHYYGSRTAMAWRNAQKSGSVTQGEAKRTAIALTEKYGPGWLYRSESAQIDAMRRLG